MGLITDCLCLLVLCFYFSSIFCLALCTRLPNSFKCTPCSRFLSHRLILAQVQYSTKYLNQGVTLTFDLQNLIRSVRASEYSPSVLSKLFKPFTRYHGNNIWLDERMENGRA